MLISAVLVHLVKGCSVILVKAKQHSRLLEERNLNILDRNEYIENGDDCLKKIILRVYLERERREGEKRVGGNKIGRSKIRNK